jgi:hypothetical protein
VSEKLIVLDEYVEKREGSFVTIVRYLQGKYPELGTLLQPEVTLSGDWETKQIIERVIPAGVIDILNNIEKKTMG